MHQSVLSCVAVLFLAGFVFGQGIVTKRSAVVLFGSVSNCSQPATIDHDKVCQATPEWRTIRSEGVEKGSARHDLLISAMNARIKKAVGKAADRESCDCVVRKGDVKKDNGLTVKDLTAAVLEAMDA